jgi:hypothetical protein
MTTPSPVDLEPCKLLREIDEYLSGHPQNAIYCGSKLHQDVKRFLRIPSSTEPSGEVEQIRQDIIEAADDIENYAREQYTSEHMPKHVRRREYAIAQAKRLRDYAAALSHPLEGRWMEWRVGDATQEGRRLVTHIDVNCLNRDMPPAVCEAYPYSGRFLSMESRELRVIAYWSIPLPPPYKVQK